MSDPRRPEEQRRTHRARPSAGDVHVDVGGIGEIFKGLDSFFQLLGQMVEEGTSEVNRTREFGGPGGVRGVYGFSVKTGLGGTPTVEHFGNVYSTKEGPSVSDVREPLVDIFDEKDYILVVAELPGVTEDQIQVAVADDVLTLSSTGRDRKYAKKVVLPAIVDPASLRRTYQNGILEVRVDKVLAR
jgi:HSP20 family protein